MLLLGACSGWPNNPEPSTPVEPVVDAGAVSDAGGVEDAGDDDVDAGWVRADGGALDGGAVDAGDLDGGTADAGPPLCGTWYVRYLGLSVNRPMVPVSFVPHPGSGYLLSLMLGPGAPATLVIDGVEQEVDSTGLILRLDEDLTPLWAYPSTYEFVTSDADHWLLGATVGGVPRPLPGGLELEPLPPDHPDRVCPDEPCDTAAVVHYTSNDEVSWFRRFSYSYGSPLPLPMPSGDTWLLARGLAGVGSLGPNAFWLEPSLGFGNGDSMIVTVLDDAGEKRLEHVLWDGTLIGVEAGIWPHPGAGGGSVLLLVSGNTDPQVLDAGPVPDAGPNTRLAMVELGEEGQVTRQWTWVQGGYLLSQRVADDVAIGVRGVGSTSRKLHGADASLLLPGLDDESATGHLEIIAFDLSSLEDLWRVEATCAGCGLATGPNGTDGSSWLRLRRLADDPGPTLLTWGEEEYLLPSTTEVEGFGLRVEAATGALLEVVPQSTRWESGAPYPIVVEEHRTTLVGTARHDVPLMPGLPPPEHEHDISFLIRDECP